MNIFPAIDIYEGNAVRLYKGDYSQMTIYNSDPCQVAENFQSQGAQYLHLVDLEGAKLGSTPNLPAVEKIISKTSMFTEIGGGIRSLETIDKYLSIGINRVILGTAAINDFKFLEKAIEKYGGGIIAVGVDLINDKVALKGWTEVSDYDCFQFCSMLEQVGVKTIICTDVSKDGAMKGTNRQLYANLSKRFSLNIIASGGVSSLEDVDALSEMDIYGAILGKALYTDAIDLQTAIRRASK